MNLVRISFSFAFFHSSMNHPKTVMSLNFPVTPEVHVHFIRFHSYNIVLPAVTSIFIISISVRNKGILGTEFPVTTCQSPDFNHSYLFMSIQEIHVSSNWVLDKIPSVNRSVFNMSSTSISDYILFSTLPTKSFFVF